MGSRFAAVSRKPLLHRQVLSRAESGWRRRTCLAPDFVPPTKPRAHEAPRRLTREERFRSAANSGSDMSVTIRSLAVASP
jgi:hypothetical protein